MHKSLVLIFILLLAGCTDPKNPDHKIKVPTSADVNIGLRQQNYNGGSCVHASMVTALQWQNMESLATWWARTYSGGETAAGLIQKSLAAGINVAYTTSWDTNLLEWCARTRRIAVIFYYPEHCVNFCGYVTRNGKEYAVLLDNNSVSNLLYIHKTQFLTEWKSYGGFALVPVHAPSPPIPRS